MTDKTLALIEVRNKLRKIGDQIGNKIINNQVIDKCPEEEEKWAIKYAEKINDPKAEMVAYGKIKSLQFTHKCKSNINKDKYDQILFDNVEICNLL